MHRQIQNKPCVSWWYIDVLRLETIGLCEKLNSIYIIFLTKNNQLFLKTVLDGSSLVSTKNWLIYIMYKHNYII